MYTITRPCEVCGKEVRSLVDDIDNTGGFILKVKAHTQEYLVGQNESDDYIKIFACDVCTNKINKEFNVLEYVLEEYLNIIENAIMWKYNIQKSDAHDIMSRNKSYKEISEQINIYSKVKPNEK